MPVTPLFSARSPLAAAAALLAGACCGLLGAAEWRVTLADVDGGESVVDVQELTPDGLRTAGGDVPYTKIADLTTTVVQQDSNLPKIVLRNGDVIRARIVSGGETGITLGSDLFGEQTVALKLIDGLIFPHEQGAAPEALEAFFAGAPAKQDRLLPHKGSAIEGTFEKLSDVEVTFFAGNQARKYTFDKLSAVRIAPLEEFTPKKTLRARVALKDGSLLTGTLSNLKAGKLALEVATGETWTVPAEAVRSISFAGGKLVKLSDREPKTVEQRGLVSGLPFVYGWKKNKSCEGNDLQIGTQRFDHGIGQHSISTLTYELTGGYVRFLADVGLSNGVPARSTTEWKVLVDGKVAASGTVKAGDAPQAVKVELNGAQTLALVCEAGSDADDTGDSLIWGRARLIRP